MVLAPTELALINLDHRLSSIDLDSRVRTTKLNRAAFKKHQHGFPAEHAPFCDCMCTQAIFALDLGGSFAAHGVVCN